LVESERGKLSSSGFPDVRRPVVPESLPQVCPQLYNGCLSSPVLLHFFEGRTERIEAYALDAAGTSGRHSKRSLLGALLTAGVLNPILPAHCPAVHAMSLVHCGRLDTLMRRTKGKSERRIRFWGVRHISSMTQEGNRHTLLQGE